MDSYTVAENTSSYTVKELSDNDNYNVSITAVGVCGMITSDSVTVYGECASMYHIRQNIQGGKLSQLLEKTPFAGKVSQTSCKCHHFIRIMNTHH